MKKTQVALAAMALAASTAALAEVTLYGTLDAAVEKTTAQSQLMNGAGGFVAGNNFGLRGSEELSNGMKASFVLQQGIDMRQGAAANGGGGGSSFNQVSQVGLSGEFGSLTLGQQLSPYIGAFAGGMKGNGNFFVNHIIVASGGNAAGAGANQAGGFFIPNAVTYSIPTTNGFNATIMTTTSGDGGDGVAATSDVTNKYTAGSISTSVGNINLAYAFDNRKASYKNQLVTASTTFGDLGLAATYNNFSPDAGTNYSSYSVSGSYPLSDAATLVVQYGGAKNPADQVTDVSLTSAHINYAFSKTTSAYIQMTKGTGGASSAYLNRGTSVTGTAVEGQTTTSFGLVHSF